VIVIMITSSKLPRKGFQKILMFVTAICKVTMTHKERMWYLSNFLKM